MPEKPQQNIESQESDIFGFGKLKNDVLANLFGDTKNVDGKLNDLESKFSIEKLLGIDKAKKELKRYYTEQMGEVIRTFGEQTGQKNPLLEGLEKDLHALAAKEGFELDTGKSIDALKIEDVPWLLEKGLLFKLLITGDNKEEIKKGALKEGRQYTLNETLLATNQELLKALYSKTPIEVLLPDPYVKELQVVRKDGSTEVFEQKYSEENTQFVSVSGEKLAMQSIASFSVLSHFEKKQDKEELLRIYNMSRGKKVLNHTRPAHQQEVKEEVADQKKNKPDRFIEGETLDTSQLSLDSKTFENIGKSFNNKKFMCANFVRSALGITNENKKTKANLLWVPDLIPELEAWGGQLTEDKATMKQKILSGLKPGSVIAFSHSYAGVRDHVGIVGEDGFLYHYALTKKGRAGWKYPLQGAKLAALVDQKGTRSLQIDTIVEFPTKSA